MTPSEWLASGKVSTPLWDMLLAGTVGREHLLYAADLAGRTNGPDSPEDMAQARGRRLRLLASALEEDSLYGPTAEALLGTVASLPSGPPALDPAFAALVQTLASRFTIPANTAYFSRLQAAGDENRLQRYLENECRAGRHALFWLHVALRQAVLRRDFDWGEARIAALPPELAPLGHKLAGDLALLSDRPKLALTRYVAAGEMAPWPAGLLRLGLAAWRCGETDRAMHCFAAMLRVMPEHFTAALALYDLAFGRSTATAPVPGSLAIALYTYNKSADLDQTLASLFASPIGDAPVFILDNAATDDTPAVVAAWTDRVGPRLSSIRLPVNIGAPAARNWLAADPRIRQADFVVYLDDDVDLPPDWLLRLGAAVTAYPEAGVWGCHVADSGNPAVAQGIDAMLLPARSGNPDNAPRCSDAHAEGFDYGAFAHLRPCLSVMGCCHLFRRERLEACGGFDIRFSPSQYDDVDHDLRLVLAGRAPVYQGHLTIGHRRPAPVFAPSRSDQSAGSQANRHKLLAKHQERFGELAATMRRIASEDLEAKWRALAAARLIE
jgi:hypothetical protein